MISVLKSIEYAITFGMEIFTLLFMAVAFTIAIVYFLMMAIGIYQNEKDRKKHENERRKSG